MTKPKSPKLPKLSGLHQYRFEANPEEKRFALAWDTHNRDGGTLAYLLDTNQGQGLRPPEPSERDQVVAATVIQWLGSPVGQFFLTQLGYAKLPGSAEDAERDLLERIGTGTRKKA
jgi:hypothetical protein